MGVQRSTKGAVKPISSHIRISVQDHEQCMVVASWVPRLSTTVPIWLNLITPISSPRGSRNRRISYRYRAVQNSWGSVIIWRIMSTALEAPNYAARPSYHDIGVYRIVIYSWLWWKKVSSIVQRNKNVAMDSNNQSIPLGHYTSLRIALREDLYSKMHWQQYSNVNTVYLELMAFKVILLCIYFPLSTTQNCPYVHPLSLRSHFTSSTVIIPINATHLFSPTKLVPTPDLCRSRPIAVI